MQVACTRPAVSIGGLWWVAMYTCIHVYMHNASIKPIITTQVGAFPATAHYVGIHMRVHDTRMPVLRHYIAWTSTGRAYIMSCITHHPLPIHECAYTMHQNWRSLVRVDTKRGVG